MHLACWHFFVQLIHSSNAVCSSNIGEFVNLISINQSLFLERYIKEDQSHTINLIAKILIEKSSEIDHQGRSKNFNVIFFLLLIFDTADEKVAKSHIIFFEGRTSTFVCVFVWVYALFQFKISFWVFICRVLFFL